jgi:iron complex outermembrane receptor protein
MSNRTIRASALFAATSLTAFVSAPLCATKFDVPAQPAQSGIASFARQSGLQILVPGRILQSRRTSEVRGDMEPRQALRHLIEGTGLRITKDDGRTIILGSSETGTRYAALMLAGGQASAAPVQDSAPASDIAASPAPAAAAPAEDVVVTARRTSERLQDVPVAVTAFGGQALAARAVDTLDQIARYTPNIRFDGAAQLSGGNYNATVFIRGVGSNDFAIFSDPGVGFYVDDVYYARSIGGIMDAVDIDSVQVLRGPQGTLFGKNTIGGAVLISTANPELGAFSGRLEGTYGRFQRKDVKGAINVPIGDTAAFRLSAATLHRDGYVKRLLDGEDMGNRNADMIRGKFRYQPSDALTVDLGADYTRAREHSAPSDLLAVANAPGITGIPFLANYNKFVAPTLSIVAPDGKKALDASWITRSPFETWAGGPNRNDLDLWGAQGIVNYRMGGATLKSITAYRHMKAYFTRDGDNTPYTFRQTTNRDKQWQFSQELQLTGKAADDRLSYVLGAYYFKEKAQDLASADLAIGLWAPFPPPESPAVFPNNWTRNRSLAAYAQVDYNLTPSLQLEVGGRYSDDRKHFRTLVIRQKDNVAFIDATRDGKFSKFTPRVAINYKVDPDVLLYASYSQGFKQGGFNGRPLASAAEVTRYNPEVLDSYEVGIKSQWLDHALTANLALFHSIYKDIQLTVNQTPQNFVANAAKGKIDGMELELVARPVRWFSANATIGYLDARYSSVGQGLGPTQILPITINSGFVKAPKWTTSAGAEVSHDMDDGSRLSLRGDVSTYSRIFNDVANTPLITEDGYTLVNARLSYSFASNRVTVAVFGTNLTNSLYIVSGNASGGFGLAEASYGRPREWGISAGFRF